MESDPTNYPDVPPTGERSLPQTATNGLLLAGSCLVVIGILVLISSSWSSFSPLGRILTATLPLVALYALGFATQRTAHLRLLSRATILTGSIIFPFVLGVDIYQFSLPRPFTGAFLIFLTATVSVVWFALLEFAGSLRRHCWLTLAAAVVAAVSFANFLDLAGYYYALLALALGYLALSVSWLLDHAEVRETEEVLAYTYAGTALGWLGAFFLPIALANLWKFSDADLPLVTSMYLAEGAILFALAILYSRDWQRSRSATSLGLRQVTEQSAALTLVLPAIFAALATSGEGSDSTANTLIVITLGVLSLAVSGFIRIGTFRVLGALAVAVGILQVLVFALDTLEAGWTIVLLILGFVLIGLAFTLNHFAYKQIWKRLWEPPADSLFGLGIFPVEPEPSVRSSADGSQPMGVTGSPGKATPIDSWIRFVTYVIGALVVFYLLSIMSW